MNRQKKKHNDEEDAKDKNPKYRCVRVRLSGTSWLLRRCRRNKVIPTIMLAMPAMQKKTTTIPKLGMQS